MVTKNFSKKIKIFAFIEKFYFEKLLNGELIDIELYEKSDWEIAQLGNHFVKVKIEEVDNQDFQNFSAKESAQKGEIVVERFRLEKSMMQLIPVTKTELSYFNKENQRINFVKVKIERVKATQKAI